MTRDVLFPRPENFRDVSLNSAAVSTRTFHAKKYFILTKNSVIHAFAMRLYMAMPATAEDRIPYRDTCEN